MKIAIKCHRCGLAFQREQSRTAAARGREHDYCSRECARAASAIQAQIARQAKDTPARAPYQLKPHQRFTFTPSEKSRVLASPPAPMAREGRDAEESEARPVARKVEIAARVMPSVRVF